MIKKGCRTIPDDPHRVGEAIGRIRFIQLRALVTAAYEMRDEVRQPRDRDGSEDHTGRPHTQTVRVRLGTQGDLERCVARNGCDACGSWAQRRDQSPERADR
jgi:hypothetical protein